MTRKRKMDGRDKRKREIKGKGDKGKGRRGPSQLKFLPTPLASNGHTCQ